MTAGAVRARPGGRSGHGGGSPAAPAGWWPDVVGCAAALSMLVVVALWVRDRGLQELFHPTDGLTSLGTLTGLSPPTCCWYRCS